MLRYRRNSRVKSPKQAARPTLARGIEEERVQPTWKELDSELERLPTALCAAGNDLMIEWVYVIDLDSELFSTNSWIFFELPNIPRNRTRVGKLGLSRRKESGLQGLINIPKLTLEEHSTANWLVEPSTRILV